MSKHTPGPWTTKPGVFWVCKVGNNPDDPGVWSTAIPPDGTPFPFGDKLADARLIAAAPDLLAVAREFTKAAHDARAALNAAGIPCPASIALAAEHARHAIAKAEGHL